MPNLLAGDISILNACLARVDIEEHIDDLAFASCHCDAAFEPLAKHATRLDEPLEVSVLDGPAILFRLVACEVHVLQQICDDCVRCVWHRNIGGVLIDDVGRTWRQWRLRARRHVILQHSQEYLM